MARFLLDENLTSSVLVDALKDAGHEVVTVFQTELVGARDDEVFRRAQERRLIIVTQDVQFMNFPQGDHSGIVVLRLSRLAPPAWLDRVVAALTFEIGDIEGRRAIVNERRTRIRRL